MASFLVFREGCLTQCSYFLLADVEWFIRLAMGHSNTERTRVQFSLHFNSVFFLWNLTAMV